MCVFEFDEEKSSANLKKHGMDFQNAQEIWDDPDLLEFRAKTSDESRYLLIGRIGGKHWSAIVTYREDKIRLISVRRSRKSEMELYESERFR